MDLGPLANTSRREMLLIILRSPVITWSVGLYMNGELAQVQSGGIDLKSSILRSRNTFVINILGAGRFETKSFRTLLNYR